MVLFSVVMGQFTFRYGFPPRSPVACGLWCGTLGGLHQRLLVAKVKLPPFIVTLGMQSFWATNFPSISKNETIRAQDIEAEAAAATSSSEPSSTWGEPVFTVGVVLHGLCSVFVMALRPEATTAWGRQCPRAVRRTTKEAPPSLSGVQIRPCPEFSVYHASGAICAFAGLGASIRADPLGVAHVGRARLISRASPPSDRGHLAFSAARRARILGAFFGSSQSSACSPLACGFSGRCANGPISLIGASSSSPPSRFEVSESERSDRLIRTPFPPGQEPSEALIRVTGTRTIAVLRTLPGGNPRVIAKQRSGKSTVDKGDIGSRRPDEGRVILEGSKVNFHSPLDARKHGIETVYQQLAMSPALSIADNIFMGRELRKPGIMGKVFRQLDRPAMEKFAREKLNDLGLMTIQNIRQAVETLSGGQRQGVAVARAAAFGSKGHHPRRADRRARRQGKPAGTRAHSRREEARHSDRAHQPQHAPCLRGGRSHPHPSARQAHLRDPAQGLTR